MATTEALPGRGIRSVSMTDGSNGLAMNLPDFSGKVPATCFPTSSALAASWDPELVSRVAAAIAAEARAAGADVLLSPGMNLKRDPRGGRNFEYYSEDPLLTGELAAAFVRGAQSTGIGACVKHFAVNNQETDRMRVSAEVSERALRELYLPAFETVVRRAKPWMVMAAYNRINGAYATEDRRLLTGILRDEWGFDGVVVSDWGAVDDRVRALRAGTDLEMPSTSGASDAQVARAVEDGELDRSVVDVSADRLIGLAHRADAAGPAPAVDADAAGELAVEAARRSAVLLTNRDHALPLTRGQRVAVLGGMAASLRYQGGGSAAVNARTTPEPLAAALTAAHGNAVPFAQGYRFDLDPDTPEAEALIAEAIAVAEELDVAVVVVGLPDAAESEGFDRADLALPASQHRLIEAVAAVAPRTVVVVVSGGVVELGEWRGRVDAILFAGLAGQGVATAIADLLTGAASPSGRLSETWPVRLQDAPSFLSFPGEAGRSVYGEGVFVGYRGYDAVDRDVAFPFGHGLAYTTFEYESMRVVADAADGTWNVDLRLRNSGRRPGREVVQIYLERPHGTRAAPVRALAGFAALELEAGASGSASISVPRRALERWDEATGGWVLDPGAYRFVAAASSRDLRLGTAVDIDSAVPMQPLTPESTLQEWLAHPVLGPALLERVSASDDSGRTIGMLTNPHALLMIGGLPIRRLAVDAGSALTDHLLDDVIARFAPQDSTT
ncbi:hypothetical protein GB864_10020 [Agromyces sp. MMS17-SY077]|uniref:Fibronectin type III-like domain-containing protein n=2 Tax=Agromyces seonyuensis TaxID=2662446 RepID=A0A6I4P066_9MICO|nr:hypothetical protein [Agromyces seonyuensis]